LAGTKFSDAQNGASPAYACVNHSQAWCSDYVPAHRIFVKSWEEQRCSF